DDNGRDNAVSNVSSDDASSVRASSPDVAVSGSESPADQSEFEPASSGDTNADILKAAFSEDADDDDTPH
ncbi:MAG: hypothetical protein QMC05_02965, partial [Pseudomonadales bacterium]